MNLNLSLQILQLANNYACAQKETAEETVKRAMLYRYFIEEKGETSEEGLPPVTVTHAVEPGAVRRKRRTKAEMEASKEPVVISFEEIQGAMLKLFDREFGLDAAKEIFDSFGIKSANELKPDQYRECLELLQEALDGKPLV